MPELGRLAVCLALLFAAYGTLAGVAGGIRRRAHLVRSAEHAAYAVFGLVVIATAILLRALLRHDFTLEYVAAYSSSTLPTQYTVAALWGGQKGSLLFWSLLLTLFTTIVQVQNRERNRALMPFVTATLMTVAVFFLSLLVFVTDPFERLPVAAREGADLNPLLQNYWMMIHPPSLYTGYVSASVPFAFAIAALATGQLGDQWTRSVRRWALFSWAFLSLGNLLGARWAYEVLGWGGYWAWDPVENAAFMPWLVSTAYLHSVMIQEKRDMLRVWNVVLVLLTFALTIFGTFLTRSGVISSVHSFTQSGLGPFFIGFLLVVLVVSGGLVVYRLPELRTPATVESFLSREAAFLFNNLILVGIAFAVFWGTVFPVVSEWVRGVKITVGPPFFNRVNAPLGVALLFLAGVGPVIAWRRASPPNLWRAFAGPVAAGVVAPAAAAAPGAGGGSGAVHAPLRARHEAGRPPHVPPRRRRLGVARRQGGDDAHAREALLQEAPAADHGSRDARHPHRGPLPRPRLLRRAVGAGDDPRLREPARVVDLDQRRHHGPRYDGGDVADRRRAACARLRARRGAGDGGLSVRAAALLSVA